MICFRYTSEGPTGFRVFAWMWQLFFYITFNIHLASSASFIRPVSHSLLSYQPSYNLTGSGVCCLTWNMCCCFFCFSFLNHTTDCSLSLWLFSKRCQNQENRTSLYCILRSAVWNVIIRIRTISWCRVWRSYRNKRGKETRCLHRCHFELSCCRYTVVSFRWPPEHKCKSQYKIQYKRRTLWSEQCQYLKPFLWTSGMPAWCVQVRHHCLFVLAITHS